MRRVLAVLAAVFAALRIAGPAASQPLEYDVNRPGSDVAVFDLPRADPEACRAACISNNACKAFT